MNCDLNALLSSDNKVTRYFRVTYKEKPRRKFGQCLSRSEVVIASTHVEAINKTSVRRSNGFAFDAKLCK